MDAESIKSLISILVWGGAFFLMMRFGCGAHVMGRHGGHGTQHRDERTPSGGQQKDVVCGMRIDATNAAAASVYEGRTYYFCSASCRDKFEAAPHSYSGAAADASRAEGGHHHA
jgi:YHS domain-containing protein